MNIVRHIYIDSRSRATGTPANASFILNRGLHGLSQIHIRSFSFSNVIYNIDEYNNKLTIGNDVTTATIVIPPKFYTTGEFVVALNSQILAFMRIQCPSIIGTVVSIQNNTLTWNILYGYRLLGGTMSDVIGMFQTSLTGTFETTLTLSSPQAISVICREVQSQAENITVQKNLIGFTPLLITSLDKGYGLLEVYEPQTRYIENFSIRDTDRLSFLLCDPRTGRILSEITSWSLILQIVSK